MIDPRLLQLCDSAFPSGAFSHSFGLETAIAERDVRSAPAVRAWIEDYLLHGVATMDARAIVLGLAGVATPLDLDEYLSAAVFASDARAATRRLARATLDAFVAMGLAGESIAGYRDAVGAHAAFGHHAIACMLGYRAIGAAAEDAVCAHLSAAAAALAAVGARAIPLGQRDVGALLWSLRPAIAHAARDAAANAHSLADLHTGAVVCEIDAMRHAGLDARLFAS